MTISNSKHKHRKRDRAVSPAYETKFANFLKQCANTKKGDLLIIATPHALGDTYDELIESLNRIADAELHLASAAQRSAPRRAQRTEAKNSGSSG